MPTTVLFVQDRERSIRFYSDYLFQEVELDLGPCVSFRSGFSIWESQEVAKVTELDAANTLIRGRGGMELYFEVWDVDRLYQKMLEGDIHIIHQIREQPWAQRVYRCMDPDGHFIEVAESLIVTAERLTEQGQSPAEIARTFGFAPEQVEEMLNLARRLSKELPKHLKKGLAVGEIASKYELEREIIEELVLELPSA